MTSAHDTDSGGDYDADMDHRMTMLEAKWDAVLPTLATKSDVAELRVEIQKGVNETHRWMIATVIGLFIGFAGLFLAMSNTLKPQTIAVTAPAR
jgi:hypothetical protein